MRIPRQRPARLDDDHIHHHDDDIDINYADADADVDDDDDDIDGSGDHVEHDLHDQLDQYDFHDQGAHAHVGCPTLVHLSLIEQRAVIVVDPGHNGGNGTHLQEINRLVNAGGFDKACNTTGTAGDGYAETEFNWELAQAVRTQLEQLGATVVLTRPDNSGWGPCVDERGLTASRNHAALLLSLHADGAPPAAHGFHVIHPSSILGYTAATSGPSATAAASVRDSLVAAGFQPATYVGRQGLIARGDLGTLNRAGTPAVMVECGNMRNASDLAVLRSSDGRARLAQALVRGIATWIG